LRLTRDDEAAPEKFQNDAIFANPKKQGNEEKMMRKVIKSMGIIFI
jgi:hypothetical protein